MSDIRCKHRHTPKTHPQCFQDGKLIDDAQWWKQLKTGYLDIETMGFNGTYYYMISWAIYDLQTGEIFSDAVTPNDISSLEFDKRIVKTLMQKMSEYECLVTYYGTGFDIPFVRTRAFSNGLNFFNFGQIKHIDLYYLVKAKLKLQRNSLEAACALFGIKGKNHVDPHKWMLAGMAISPHIDYVLDHNHRDVEILKQLHDKLATQGKFTKRSI